MKATGIVRRIDDIGRINIPKEIRMQIFGTQATVGEPMEIFLDGNDIVLRKYESEEKRKEKEIRNKAIDDFEKSLIGNSRTEVIDGRITLIVTEKRIKLIAEQLKAGGTDD